MNIILKTTLLLTILGSCRQNISNQTKQDTHIPNDINQIGAMLDSIHTQDQQYRIQLEEISAKYGWESSEIKNHWKVIGKTDSSNLRVIECILDKHGWLGAEQVGERANAALFLVIQHSNQQSQEKYLPLMRQAVKEGKARAQDLALLEDRVKLGKGELQVYGSQIGRDEQTGEMYVLPLIDPENVNERRAKVGLGPIESYISNWNAAWNVEEYQKKLPQRIEKLREGKNKNVYVYYLSRLLLDC